MRSSTPFAAPHFITSHPRCDRACGREAEGCTFQVAWSINPHMKIGAVQPRHAVGQHDRLVAALRAAGAVVTPVPFVHGAFDSVFSKDNGVVVRRANGAVEAMLARPRHAERAAEQEARAASLRALGVAVTASAPTPLEGGDVVVLPAACGAFLGHGFRSSAASAHALSLFLDRDVTTLELRDPHLYHLDMAVAALDDGTVLVCEEALTPASHAALRAHPAVREVIRVPHEEALRFGVNLVQVGRTIVWGADAPRTTRALVQRGYRVNRVPLDQFHLAGGSAACLVSRIHAQGAGAEELAPQSTAA